MIALITFKGILGVTHSVPTPAFVDFYVHTDYKEDVEWGIELLSGSRIRVTEEVWEITKNYWSQVA